VNYCNWLSGEKGLSPAYTIEGTRVTWNKGSDGYRLPTEAEWEYACRAGTATVFNIGNNITTGQANYDGRYPYNGAAAGTFRNMTLTVDSFTPNAWGLYNMHGNVWEWCWDRYGLDYYSGDEASGTDPDGPDTGDSRVARGGSWFGRADEMRSAARSYYAPSVGATYLGFRLVRGPVGASE
jgi:formylglycine-generating enzyme required for sulfatase activity